jgi:hypothetical protein
VFRKVWTAIPDWIRQIIITLVFILIATILIRSVRRIWTTIRSTKRFRSKTIWDLLPLTAASGSTDGQKATDGLHDALARLGHELDRNLWQPGLLLLRPAPPPKYEPAIISDFLHKDASQPAIVITPAMPQLRLE